MRHFLTRLAVEGRPLSLSLPKKSFCAAAAQREPSTLGLSLALRGKLLDAFLALFPFALKLRSHEMPPVAVLHGLPAVLGHFGIRRPHPELLALVRLARVLANPFLGHRQEDVDIRHSEALPYMSYWILIGPFAANARSRTTPRRQQALVILLGEPLPLGGAFRTWGHLRSRCRRAETIVRHRF